MRIAITGAPGVGKTTLAQELSKILKLPLISEQARIVAKLLGIKHTDELYQNKNLAREFQTAILISQLGMEEVFPDGFVSDRATLDCLAYWQVYGLEEGTANEIYRQRCLSQSYDYYIYVPMEEEVVLKDDGFRNTDQMLAAEVDNTIKKLFQQISSPIIMVLGSVEERISVVLKTTKGGVVVAHKPSISIKTNIGA